MNTNIEKLKLKEIYDLKVFKQLLNGFVEEYKHEGVYDEIRVKAEFEEYKNRQLILFCLVDDNEKIYGYISARAGFETSHFANVCKLLVPDEFRAHGYGKKMLILLEKHLRNCGVKQTIIGSRRGKEGFYISCGYNGEGLLQGNASKIQKDEMETILNDCNIYVTGYKLQEGNIHQFYFDAKEILDNKNFTNKIDADKRMKLIVVFTKDIEKTKEK